MHPWDQTTCWGKRVLRFVCGGREAGNRNNQSWNRHSKPCWNGRGGWKQHIQIEKQHKSGRDLPRQGRGREIFRLALALLGSLSGVPHYHSPEQSPGLGDTQTRHRQSPQNPESFPPTVPADSDNNYSVEAVWAGTREYYRGCVISHFTTTEESQKGEI